MVTLRIDDQSVAILRQQISAVAQLGLPSPYVYARVMPQDRS